MGRPGKFAHEFPGSWTGRNHRWKRKFVEILLRSWLYKFHPWFSCTEVWTWSYENWRMSDFSLAAQKITGSLKIGLKQYHFVLTTILEKKQCMEQLYTSWIDFQLCDVNNFCQISSSQYLTVSELEKRLFHTSDRKTAQRAQTACKQRDIPVRPSM